MYTLQTNTQNIYTWNEMFTFAITGMSMCSFRAVSLLCSAPRGRLVILSHPPPPPIQSTRILPTKRRCQTLSHHPQSHTTHPEARTKKTNNNHHPHQRRIDIKFCWGLEGAFSRERIIELLRHHKNHPWRKRFTSQGMNPLVFVWHYVRNKRRFNNPRPWTANLYYKNGDTGSGCQ